MKAAANRSIDLSAAIVPVIAIFGNIIAPLIPRRVLKLKEVSNNVVDDFLQRHGRQIEKVTRPLEFRHKCPYPPGKKSVRFSWRFPFVRLHVYKTVCCCDVNFLISQISHALHNPRRVTWGLVEPVDEYYEPFR